MNGRALVALLLAGVLVPAWAAHEHAAPATPRDPATAWQKSLARPPLAVGAAFDARGRLWRAQVDNGRLLVSRSEDAGQTFAPAVAVNPEAERIAADGENRPKLAFGRDGEVYVSWTRSLDAPFSGHVRFSRSLDDGRTFSAPLTVNDNRETISHRFESLLVDGRGRVWLTWLDKRDQSAAKQRGQPYTGAALYYAVSADRGASFSANRRLAAHSCECCRIALALDTDGMPVAFWRQVFGTNVRDHALLRIGADPAPRRVTHEGWAVDACPHHGPALAIGADGVYHLAWFSGAPGQAGLYYARSGDRGVSLSTPMRLGQPEAQAGRATLTAVGNAVALAWKEFDGQAAVVRLIQSLDGGLHWTAARTIARTAGNNDHPQLLAHRGTTYLAWNSAHEGFRLIALDGTDSTP
jgi:hypothetical protein